jgi:hypothetical protein
LDFAGRSPANANFIDCCPVRISCWRRLAEGLAVRDALRFAFKECRVEVAELDEKSPPDLAANALDTSSMAIDARLKALGATVGRPWRKEQKLACLSAWFALTVQR